MKFTFRLDVIASAVVRVGYIKKKRIVLQEETEENVIP